jgi:hypothetical protein
MSRFIDQIAAQVAVWDGVTSAPHRFGGTEFLLEGREIGHVHDFGLADIVFSRPLRDQLVAEDQALPHHIYPDSGFISFYVKREPDVEHALWLFKLALLRHWTVLKRRSERHPMLPDIDVVSELAQLKVSPALQAIFDTMLQGQTIED